MYLQSPTVYFINEKTICKDSFIHSLQNPIVGWKLIKRTK